MQKKVSLHKLENVFFLLVFLSGVAIFYGSSTVSDFLFPVSKGMGLIAPANIPHCIRNDSEEPFTIVYSWPATDVERFIVKK